MGMFGRSHDLRQLDQALRSVDVHPAVVPEAYRAAAEIVGYCMVGADIFAGANAAEVVLAVERRIEAALQSGESLDAQLVLLTLHAGVIQPSVVRAYGLETTRE